MSILLVADRPLGVLVDTAVAAQPDLEVVGRADSVGQAARQSLCCGSADVVVLDARKAPTGGARLDTLLTSCGVRPSRVLLIVAEDESGWVSTAARAGIRGLTRRDTLPQDISRAIRSIASRKPHIPPGLAARLFDYVAGLPKPKCDEIEENQLTRREVQVLRPVSRGLSNADIAERLCITVRTTKYHVSTLLRK